ncbi:MAG: type II toxin-antitoxin system prevent-host-death family antitoxin [Cyclobacteriaceae bacterium]
MELQYISNQRGEKKAVIVPIADFEKIQDELEELAAIKDYDNAQQEKLSYRSLDEVLKEIDKPEA